MTDSVSAVRGTPAALLQLVRRLHFYIGIFIGPFILIAALTGTLYVVTPSLEGMLYQHTLKVQPQGETKPLDQQIAAARHYIGRQAVISAVRPAPTGVDTTRVQFLSRGLGPSESRAIFVDPYRLTITGDYTVYGSSGILPFRTTLDHLHQSLLLGNLGRAYSELAASWMWIAALGGLVIWAIDSSCRRKSVKRDKPSQRWHRRLGLVLLLGMLFLSATGMTWSQWAGANIGQMRTAFHWLTPQLNRSLVKGEPVTVHNEHAEHQGMDMSSMPGMEMGTAKIPSISHRLTIADSDWVAVLNAARSAGIRANKVEIIPPKRAEQAWAVNEIDHRWPIKVDAIAIAPQTFTPVDRISFEQFPLVAKLTRWGVDAHIGLLFGWINQLILALFGSGLCVMIILGYRIWWLKRPTAVAQSPVNTLIANWQLCNVITQLLIAVVALTLAYLLPVLGISLIILLIIDLLRWKSIQRRIVLQHEGLTDEQRKRQQCKRYFMSSIVVVWLVTSIIMARAFMGGLVEEYHLPFAQWSLGMYLMQAMMIFIYTTIFTALLSIPLWYFFLGESDPQGQ